MFFNRILSKKTLTILVSIKQNVISIYCILYTIKCLLESHKKKNVITYNK